jgi:DNA-binding response OmpR family regulator
MTESNPAWKLLLVEDDIPLREELAKFFRKSGHSVVESGVGSTAVQQASAENFDAIILDMMIPEVDGLQFLSILRKIKKTPVLMISSMAELEYRINAFQLGVDDFLVKPVSHVEIQMRIRAVLNRSLTDKTTVIKIRNVEIDLKSKFATLNGVRVHLSPAEFELLVLLAKNQGKILARKLLEDKIVGADRLHFSNLIDQYIMRLRKKFGKDLIETKFGLGFVINV